jgi:AcrR family transcriptional regulator
MSDQALARRLPQQQRSRERVERILASAKSLIGANGSEALKMGELAQAADISIGSLYQYFPDKSAVIAALAERYFEEGRACIRDGLVGVTSEADLRRSFDALVDEFYGLFLAEPAMRDIWSGVVADRSLQEIELLDARQNGALLGSVLQRIYPQADPHALTGKATLVMYLGNSAMRLALAVGPDEGRRLVADFKRMALLDLVGP